MAVDGTALNTSVLAQVSEPHVTFERDELQKKLDKKEIDLMRKEKELHKYEMEVFRLQKEAKLGASENQNLRDRNETLQQSLMNARLLSQNARDEASNAFNQNRIRELESALSAAIHKIKKGELELNNWQNKWKDADRVAQDLSHELQSMREVKGDDKELIVALNAKLKAAGTLQHKLETEIDNSKQEYALLKQNMNETFERAEGKQAEVDGLTRSLAESKAELQKLKTLLKVRSETNSALRSQLEEVSGNTFTISKEEMARYKAQETELRKEKLKNSESNRSIQLHMDLLRRAEQRTMELEELQRDHKDAMSKLNMDLFEAKQKIVKTGDREKVLKKEVLRLRDTVNDLDKNVKELQIDPHTHDTEVQQMRQALSGTKKSRLDEIESKQKEQKRRKVAEESLSALRSRVSFLLEQLEQASVIAAKWQEQKAILRVEVGSLHKINMELRKRLTQVQGHYMSRGIAGLVEGEAFGETKNNDGALPPSVTTNSLAMSPYKGTGGGGTARSGAPTHAVLYSGNGPSGDILSGRSGDKISELGEYFEHPAASAVVNSIESFVERSLFDAICAFSSGTREKKTSKRANDTTGFKKTKAKMKQKPIFKVQPVKDMPGKWEIASLGSNEADIDMAANELLVGTHINSFLNFCQSRPSEKGAALYTEKIAHLLNFLHHSEQDMVEQLADSRLKLTQLSSHVAVAESRVDKLRVRYSSERTAKQKSIMKYVREQMRLSDVRVLMDSAFEKSKQSTDELEAAGLGLQDNMKGVMEVLQTVMNIAKELSLVGASSGTTTGGVGALELRLPDSEVDDETLLSVIGLLSGGIEDAEARKSMQPLNLSLYKTDGANGKEGEEVDIDNPLSATGTMVANADLAEKVYKLGGFYMGRVIMLNLRGNLLTDISCRTLNPLIEKSSILRFVDLRENAISEKGTKAIFDATRKNRSIMYVTQRQEGYMVEGHREISASRSQGPGGTTTMRPDSDSPAFSLRIDIRFQEGKVEAVTQTMFEQVDHSHYKDTNPGAFEPLGEDFLKHQGMAETLGTAVDTPKVTYSPSGFIGQMKEELVIEQNRPASRLNTLNAHVLDRKPPRPHTAGGDRDVRGMDLSLSVGAGAGGAGAGLAHGDNGSIVGAGEGGSIASDSNRIVVQSPRQAYKPAKAPNGNSDLINLIENKEDGDSAVGGLIDNQLRQGRAVGSVLDTRIRDMEQKGQVVQGQLTPQVLDSPYSGHTIVDSSPEKGGKKSKSKKVSVKTRILTNTKRIYNNKKAFGDMNDLDEADNLRSSAKSKGMDEKRAMLSSIPLPLDHGGGQASRNAASSVRGKLANAKQVDQQRAKTADAAVKGRPHADKTSATKGSASKMMNSLQKLNPSALF